MSAGVALQYSRSAGRQQRLALDPVIVTTVFALLLAGLVMVTSASTSIGERLTGDPFLFFERQLLSALLGCTVGAAILAVPISAWKRLAPGLLVASFALLVLVLVPGIGHSVNGSSRWIRIGLLNFQPSEIARWLLVTYIAVFAVRHQTGLRSSAEGFFKPLAVLVAAAVLLLFEPDFGAAVVLCVTGTAVLFVAGARMRDFLAVCGVGVLGVGALAVLSPYRLKRILAFLDPWADPFNSGFQLTQSLIAIGEMVQPGSSVLFCRRDARTAREDMARMLESIRKGLYTRPRGGVYYSCLGRGASLFGPDSGELRMIRDALGEFPLVGFFCNGEISHNRLYGYTGVLTLFV